MSGTPERPANESSKCDFEITDAMIDAGHTVLLDEISVWFGPDYDSAEVAEKVFKAMLRAAKEKVFITRLSD